MKKTIIPLTLWVLICSSLAYGAVTYFSHSTGTNLNDWQFHSDWLTGNVGLVQYQNAYLDGQDLRWYFEMQTVWSGAFDTSAKIIPPLSWNPTRTCWQVEGTATSNNAGIIQLSWVDTSLLFNPVSRKLEGYGFNEGIGRVPFWGWTSCDGWIVDDDELRDIQNWTDPDNTIDDTLAGFVGRVKVIGNAGWTTVFDTFYSQWVKFNSSLFNTTLQRIRKNVGLLTRNLSPAQEQWSLVGDKMFLIDQPTKSTSTISSTLLGDIRSLIVVGWDLYIDQNFLSNQNNPKWIIVLKNDSGIGGNVYIDGSVQRIDATIFTEGTVYSGTPTDLYNDSALEITSLPSSQLYILGSVISRNTIWGASRSATEALCPYNIVCTYDTSLRYDLNYFRVFQASGSLDPNRAYPDATFDEYSLIIKSDLRVLSSPPPGFE